MTYRSIEEFLAAVHKPIIAPNGWGLGDEFWGMGNLNAEDAIDKSLATHRLRHKDTVYALNARTEHEICHLIYGISLLVPPRSQQMNDKLFSVAYQGDKYAENFVIAVEETMVEMQLKHPSSITIESLEQSIVSKMHKWCDEPEYFLDQGPLGRKAAYFIGRETGETYHDVRFASAYNDKELHKQATALARSLGIDTTWEAEINDGDYYEVDGQRQTYTDVKNFVDDPDVEILTRRAAHVLFMLRDKFMDAAYHDDLAIEVQMAEIYEGIKLSLTDDERQSPDLAAFEDGFFSDSDLDPRLAHAEP